MIHASTYDTYLQVADVKVGDDPAEFYQLMKGLCTICGYRFTSHDSGQDQTGRYYWGGTAVSLHKVWGIIPTSNPKLSKSSMRSSNLWGVEGGIIPDIQYYT